MVAVTWMSSGFFKGESASAMAQAAGIVPAIDGRQHRAGIDRHQGVRAQGGESDLENVVGAAPRMQHRAPPAVAMRVDQRRRPAHRCSACESAVTTRSRFHAR